MSLKIMRSRCDQCLFSRARIVSAERKREILADCARRDSHFLCHKGTIAGEDIVCAGFVASGRSSGMLRMCGHFGLTVLVDGPEEQP